MTKRLFLALSLGLISIVSLSAQGFDFGLKVGINISTIDGPTEGMEEFKSAAGFTGAFTASYAVNEVFGFKTELQYLQMNYENSITDGTHFRARELRSDGRSFIPGDRDQNLNITRSYLYLPLSVYGKFWEIVEVYGGIQTGVQLNSTAAGELTFGFDSFNPTIALDYNYQKDEAGTSNSATEDFGDYFFHEQLGAYYEYDRKDDNLFKTIDFGLHAGLVFYLSETLYADARVMYGLSDGTNTSVDRSFYEHANTDFVYRDDKDRNLSFSLSLGFKL